MTNKLYWLIPAVLVIVQLNFTLNSQTQIRYEELAEAVRNPFWLSQGKVYDGVSSNVGWYGSLLLVYKLSGFHLYTAQYFKLALYFISLLCLGLLLKRWVKHAWFPLLTIGLSPTLLFYNTSQTSHGIDLLYFPICLYLTLVRPRLARLAGWALAMWAWMSYPTFIFYLPALSLLHLRGEGKVTASVHLGGVLRSLVAFLAPLVLTILFIKNRSLLWFDPQINSGIFRGAGGFDLSVDNIARNLGGFFRDLFAGGSSYHFEINQGDFSLIFPVLTAVLVLIISFKNRNKWGILALGSIAAVLVLSSLTLDPSGSPGMRRYTPLLAAFYALFVMAWDYLMDPRFRGDDKEGKDDKWHRIGIVILSLLVIHHLSVYPINLIHLKDPSPNKEPLWFSLKDTPQKSLDSMVETVQKEDLKLVCLDERGQSFYCRIVESYAAVAGSCLWNKLTCHTIYGYDYKTNSLIPLETRLWDEYYFEH